MKIVFLNDIHNGTTSESTTHPGVSRLISSQALETLERVIKKINSIQPDLVVQLGDVIRDSFEKETDKHNFHAVLGVLNAVEAPMVHVLGNHDVLALEREELSALFLANGLKDEWLGTIKLANTQIAWLDLRLDETKNAYVTEAGISLLGSLNPSLPTIVCSHYSLALWDPTDNFYTSTNPTWMSYVNPGEALEILSEKNVLAYVNAHSHWGSYSTLAGRPVMSSPSFSEWILSPSDTQYNPGVFSVLSIEEKRSTFKSYSGDFAFLNFEF